jgi:AcrR family transcriptional regulator
MAMTHRGPRRAGRRPGTSGTKEAIGDAARRLFAERGFDRTSIRAIAEAAGVDQALVMHFYGSKQRLFVTVVDLPFDPEVVIPRLLEGDREDLGRRLAGFLLMTLESEQGRARITGLMRAAASEPEAARLVRELVTTRIFKPLTEALDVDDAPLRATLVGSQVIGLTMARYVVQLEPLASAPAESVAAAIAPTFQRYLLGPLR